MRRSICYCEPPYTYAGEVDTWNFIYTPATNLPKGAKLKFDILSSDRNDWELPHVNLKQKSNVIFLRMPNGKVIPAVEKKGAEHFPFYEFVLPAAVSAGSSLAIVMGSQSDDEVRKQKEGNRCQLNALRRRPFHLWVDPSGKGKYEDHETFTMDIRGNLLTHIQIISPSFVPRNKRFDITLRFEDAFGNLTNLSQDDDTLIELTYEHLRDNLNWKLFIPETGFITLPNLYFNEEGIYVIQLRNVQTGEKFRSPPIVCFNECEQQILWGLFHGESERFDSTNNIENCLRYFRDEKALNFYASSCFENAEETSNEAWKAISQGLSECDENDRFSTFLGMQWQGDSPEEGLRQFIYNKDGKQLLRKKDGKYNSLAKIYKSFSPKELLSIPMLTMGKGYHYNFASYNPDFERVVEIYNAWGSSECTEKEGNPCPIFSSKKEGVKETAEGSIQNALKQNCRFGFIAGGLDDRGIFAPFFDNDQQQYFPGLTAIIVKEHSRSAITEALYNRLCYATTGVRMLIGFFIAGSPMGSELSTAQKPGLTVNRHISGYAAGTEKLEKVEIIRNGLVIKTFEPNSHKLEFVFDDMEAADKAAIVAKGKDSPFVYYYLRVTQSDGHIGWSSPIWVDFPATDVSKKIVEKKKSKK
jgi:hypothetical protein